MRVFLVPIGKASHVPYSEPGAADPPETTHDGRGVVGRMVARFRDVLAAAEQSRLSHSHPRDGRGAMARLEAWALRWVADRIAEQRLLWQLRGCDAAVLVHPSDVGADHALRLLMDELRRDGDRHRRWLAVNAVLLVLSGVLAIVPGPNVIAYYFAFRVVGHYFSMRGARHGTSKVTWSPEASPPLSDLRNALHLGPDDRHTRVRDIATRLDLPHLATFVERVALKGA